jgi:hypothetical protein
LTTSGFPAGDEAYHDYSEMVAEIQQVASGHSGIVSLSSIGTSNNGRAIWVAKISDNVGSDETEPEVLFIGQHHAREHMTVEMTLYLLHQLVDGYGTNSEVTNLVNSREIYIIFNANPDGGEFDIATGSYAMWRKNRQLNSDGSYGTDLNRNYGYKWGCCNGSSTTPTSETYRGVSAFSAPETAAIRDFINSRVIGGTQQIKTAITFHSYANLILWPFGYTFTAVPSDMAQDDHEVFVRMGEEMASRNGYVAEQSSELYITDGTTDDWAYGEHGIFMYTFEMGGDSFYPTGSRINELTSVNWSAVSYLLKSSGCPYNAIGKASDYCGSTQVRGYGVVNAGSYGRAVATCPAGTVVTGGGFGGLAAQNTFVSTMSGNTWQVFAYNGATSTLPVYAYATCLPYEGSITTASYTGTKSVAMYSSDCAYATCPVGTTVTGGGFSGPQLRSTLSIYKNSNYGNGWVTCGANYSSSSQTIAAYAVCASGLVNSVNATTAQKTIAAGSYASVAAVCPAGAIATGGGWDMDPNLTLYYNTKSTTTDTWDAKATNSSGNSGSLNSVVMCMK